MRVLDGEEQGKRAKRIFEEIAKDNNLHIQEAQWTPSRIKRSTEDTS